MFDSLRLTISQHNMVTRAISFTNVEVPTFGEQMIKAANILLHVYYA